MKLFIARFGLKHFFSGRTELESKDLFSGLGGPKVRHIGKMSTLQVQGDEAPPG